MFKLLILCLLCWGRSQSFVLHPPSRADDDDGGTDDQQPAVPLTPPQTQSSSHRDGGYTTDGSTSCNATLCKAGSLSSSCCSQRGIPVQPWIWILGLVATVAMLGLITYCSVWRKKHGQPGRTRVHLWTVICGRTTYADCSDCNTQQRTPPPTYIGVPTPDNLPAVEDPPPTYDEAMEMSPGHISRRLDTPHDPSRNARGQHARRRSADDVTMRILADDSDTADIPHSRMSPDVNFNVAHQNDHINRHISPPPENQAVLLPVAIN